MEADHIVLLAVKRTVIAFDKTSGERLWSRRLISGLNEDFVAVIADSKRAYAHTNGQFFCLDLFTGEILWQDGLTGLGYGIASIALADGRSSPVPLAAQKRAAAASDASASSSAHA